METRTSSLSMFQTKSLMANRGIENKVNSKSSELPKYIVSEPPMHQNSSFKRNKKQVAVSSTINFEASPYPKNLKISEAPMTQNIYRRDSKTPVTEGNAIHYDPKTNYIEISRTPKLRNSIYKRDIDERVTLGNTIHFESSAYSKDIKIFESSMSHNNFKRNSEKAGTDNKIHYDTNTDDEKIPKPLKIQNSNFKNSMQDEVSHYGKDGHPKDTRNSKAITLLEPKETKSGRIKREDSHFYYEADSTSKLEKGIKILEQDPGDPNTDDDKISKSLKLQNSNFKNDMEDEVGHYGKDGYPKDTRNSKAITLLEPKETRSGRIKREDSHFYYEAHNISKLEKGIKILEQDPGETGCNYNQCVEICNTIYFAIPIHLAQCYNNSCFCFPKKDLYPPVIKNFLKTHKLFGIQQTYE